MAELHCGFDDQVNAFVRRCDSVEMHRIVDGRVPRAHCRHLANYKSCVELMWLQSWYTQQFSTVKKLMTTVCLVLMLNKCNYKTVSLLNYAHNCKKKYVALNCHFLCVIMRNNQISTIQQRVFVKLLEQ